ncbi:thermostable hemolysin [Noviherbaspirillum sp. ST9]|uniref:thermostable hemolysin n=1 Tax=Noviherbaspirillum sp. ST9 TaxID=3401606 RepID=UPI003B5872C2
MTHPLSFLEEKPCVGDGADGLPAFTMLQVPVSHHERREVETFVADAFRRQYGAELKHFCQVLVGCKDQHGRWVAALGYSLLDDASAFLEHYLDAPIEREIACRTGLPVARTSVVEVGNLAATHVGAARTLIACMTRFLHEQGLSWVAFTATRSLLNSFNRLGLVPVVLVDADPVRLPDKGASWGSYYVTKPQVMFGDIRSGHDQLVK